MRNNIKGLKAKIYSDEIRNMMIFSGNTDTLDALKKKLTITNKSIAYRIHMLKKTIKDWSARGGEYAQEKVAVAKKDLAEIAPKLKTEYYIEKDGNIVAPAGFWYLAEEVTDNSHINTEIVPWNIETNRVYQKEALIELLKFKRATCVLATGLGKTRVIISLAISAVKAGNRTMVIVPTQDLVEQFVKSVKDFHPSVTGAYSGKIPKAGCDIMVCTVGSAERHIDKFDVIAIDESHHAPAATWAELLASCHAEYVYNFTATPFRSDGMDLAIHSFGGPTVIERDLIWGISEGWLEHFDVYCIEITGIERGETIVVPSNRLNASAYKKIVGNTHFLNDLARILLKSTSQDRRIIQLFKTLLPAKLLAKKLKKELNFSVADANWKKPLRDFQNGDSKVLVATSKLVGEGIDIPDADTLILCTQNSSDGITMQALGRILRKGGKKPIVIDIIAKGYAPFESAAKARRKIWLKAADTVTDIKIR